MLGVTVEATEDLTGRAAAILGAERIEAAIAEQGMARVIFASAPSQESMLKHLVADPRIDWARVESFHMDEYIGISMDHPQAFGVWLSERLPVAAAANLKRFHTTTDADTEIVRYSDLLTEKPIDVVFLGVGVNGHVAFNEPSDTDFEDPRTVRQIRLDDVSRQQQVDDGLFPTIEDVPETALTLTVPALISGQTMICTALGSQKAEAVATGLLGQVSTDCPATILQTHEAAFWFVDEAAASRLDL